MKTTQDMENRLVALEIKASYSEDLLDKLDQIITGQQEQINQLVREIVRLRDQGQQGDLGRPSNPQDELPPHY